ncbi:MAG: aromatic ring-hydroxylating dioxygenase subunit alpha [Gammaproteobacteria bacterium]|nr:aromatic ring-hydroxylating dioxygenase subunit alpha [Gammaproteobacteria bacterium]MYF66311.1 aromatic ring-hydroxylating dioxygenase subunit alpha [Gammaproteobacteria bacterium]MYK38328.1 aromatic ring-hydroxylating dioxygenase subunit alpha [Gammaproteobacteria bacterium]
MFINFWYPAVESGKLEGAPLKRRMLGQDFVLWRDDDGQAHCLSNTCCHRGGSLAEGLVADSCVQCPYHGWRFNGEGQCVRVPSIGMKAKPPGRARVDSYPVMERYGLVFCFLGDLDESERPPLLEIPEWGQEGWQPTLQYFEWEVEYRRAVENGIDPAHNEFVHDTHGMKGEDENYKVSDLDIRETDWGTGFYNEVYAPPLPEKRMRESSRVTGNSTITVGTGHHGPASVWTHINPSPVMKIYQYLYRVPIDEVLTGLYMVTMRNFMQDEAHDETIMKRNEYVAFQDRDILLLLHPKLAPRTSAKDMLMPSDYAVGRYRQWLAEWEARGWLIDTEKVRKADRHTAFAIPSPGRRVKKGWVVDPIPLVPATSADAAKSDQAA